MNVSLTPELEKLVHDQVAAGMYPSAGEVVRHALRLLKEQSELRERKLKALRDDVQLGFDQIDRGELTEYDEHTIGHLAQKVKARGMQRLAEQRRAPNDA
jgi:antitoxin ParD1/3/4